MILERASHEKQISKEKSIDALARMRGYDEDSPFHYHMRTRQSCNIVYLDDDFRTTKKTEDNKEY